MMSLPPGRAAAANATISTQMRVTATVSPYVRLDVVRQQPTLTISAADIERGYVDVPAGTSLRTRTNHRNGFVLNFILRSRLCARVSVRGIGSGTEIGSEGGSVRVDYTGPESAAQVSYRFYLAEGVRSGDHPWPLQVSASVIY